MLRWLILLICLSSSVAQAAIDTHEFDSDVERLRYYSFIDEMRCPKCQNQNLSGSDSPIAMDLRRELYLMIKDGRSDKEIIDFMVERYGDYILYRPRVSPVTFLLWFGPIILLITGIVVLIQIVRRRRRNAIQSAPTVLNEKEQAHLAELLKLSERNDSSSSSQESRP